MEHAWQFKPWQNRLTAMRKIIGLHPSGIRILRCRSKYSKLIGFRPSDENLYWMLARFWTSSVFIGKMKTHAKWPLKIICYFIFFSSKGLKTTTSPSALDNEYRIWEFLPKTLWKLIETAVLPISRNWKELKKLNLCLKISKFIKLEKTSTNYQNNSTNSASD